MISESKYWWVILEDGNVRLERCWHQNGRWRCNEVAYLTLDETAFARESEALSKSIAETTHEIRIREQLVTRLQERLSRL